MADFLHDDIVCNILSRLPAKPLLRLRCVSKHWNSMLREPGFMKLRSRKTIFLPRIKTLHLIDDDNSNSVVTRPHPAKDFYKNRATHSQKPRVIGTFNGIVLLVTLFDLILYNPFTGVSKKLPRTRTPTDPPLNWDCAYGVGYGYGDEHDLKVVRFRKRDKSCDVYNFKQGSWSNIKYDFSFKLYFEDDAGTYTNGFLYWIAYRRNVLIVLDVKDMVLSEMNLPFNQPRLLGTVGGCLCALNHQGTMWVMKEHNQWSKFKFRIPISNICIPLCILDAGRILMVIRSPPMNFLFIYDPTKNSWKTLNISLQNEDFWRVHVLEYIESLVSPLDIMSRARRSR